MMSASDALSELMMAMIERRGLYFIQDIFNFIRSLQISGHGSIGQSGPARKGTLLTTKPPKHV